MVKVNLHGFWVDISTNENATEAFLSVEEYPLEISPESMTEIITRECRGRFSQFVNEEFLRKELYNLISTKDPFETKPIAKGIPPEKGSDAVITFHIPKPSKEISISKGGFCDFKNRKLFQGVGKGEKILTKTPPGEGIPGNSVYGKVILPPKPRDVGLILRKNVVAEKIENEEVVKSTIDGHLIVEEGEYSLSIQVVPTLLITSDIQYATGNIVGKGSVEIQGSVLTGFSVTASGNISISGTIEAETKVNSGGNIMVGKGIRGLQGKNSANEVSALGSVQALYSEHAKIVSGKDVLLRTSVNSEIFSEGNLFVEKSLAGGTAMVLNSVKAKEIGNSRGVKTTIRCGVSHTFANQIEFIEKIISDLNLKLENAEKDFQFILHSPQAFPLEKREFFITKLTEKIAELKEQIPKVREKKDELEGKSQKRLESTISAYLFFPGVILYIGEASYRVTKEIPSASFYLCPNEEKIKYRFYPPDDDQKRKS